MKRATRTREGYHWFRGWRRPSAAQRRVLDELVQGRTNAEIALTLGISEDGVKWHLSELRQELEIDGRGELAEWWRGQRNRSAILLPFATAGRLLGNHAAVAVVTVTVLAAGIAWLAYASLDGSGDSASAGRLAVQTAVAAPAVVPPTPTPTPVPPTALVFDAEEARLTVLPGTLAGRRWLDADSGTFVGYGSSGLSVIASDGETRPLPGAGRWGDYQPVQGTTRVVIWRPETGTLVEADVASQTERVLAEFGKDAAARNWAVSAAAGRIALTDSAAREARSYAFNGRDQGLMYEAPAGTGIIHLAWSPDGSRLLILLGRRADNRLEPADRFVVVEAAGRLVLSREGVTARWAGNSWLLITPSGGQLSGGPGNASFLSVPGGKESPAGPSSSWMCVSPDGRYGVVVTEASGSANSRAEFRHELRDLRDGTTVVEAWTSQWLVSCDWTPDSRKAVLSPGGK